MADHAEPADSRNHFVRPTAQAVLAQAQQGRFLVEDFTPLAESIEFQLGQQFWRERGSKAFISDPRPVPYAINNDGGLSRRRRSFSRRSSSRSSSGRWSRSFTFWSWASASGCSRRSTTIGPRTTGHGLFREQFGKAAWEWRQERWNAARAKAQQGAFDAALTAYHEALDRQPGNWIPLDPS